MTDDEIAKPLEKIFTEFVECTRAPILHRPYA